MNIGFLRETITMHESKEFTLRKDSAQYMQIWIFRILDPRNRTKYTRRFSCGKKGLGRSRRTGLYLKDLWPCLCGHELFLGRGWSPFQRSQLMRTSIWGKFDPRIFSARACPVACWPLGESWPGVTVIPIPKTLVIWGASPVTLTVTQIAKVIRQEDAHIARVLGMWMPKTRECPYHYDTG